ncbi:outer membrane protein OmpA-like peptidoglycan-associated protein [Alteromonadaceae bacterium 2753L.S.0a.02]|nr:outer membrane protein OmpA-like peptidoglycan-associated protein [Alteromonadaceae bacterium 2753L.S.0a.02]
MRNLSSPWGILLLILCFPLFASADELRDSLFASAKGAFKEAKAELADVLAPVSFDSGAQAYASANNRYKKNQSVAKVEKDLKSATTYFRQSIKAAKVAQMTFKTAIQARTDAKGVDAEKLATDTWEKAEKQFLLATKTLETGSMSRAKTKAAEAEASFRDAELIAIKGNYLNQTRAKIEEANSLKVKKYAPKTLEEATNLLMAAEKELSENRYDSDKPRALVKEAFYQAKHSIYLAKQLEALKRKELTPEELILKLEQPVASIAAELDLAAEFDQGFDDPVLLITTEIQRLIQESHELAELKSKYQALDQEFAALETKHGIQSERLKQEEDARERLRRVADFFRRDEAMVLTQGSNVLIRMVGLNFEPGSAQINASNYGLLQKVEQAVRVYKGYTVVVEGHTDSFGSTQSNQVLSEDRANAVRQYLLVNMNDLSAGAVEAYGYGESRPIANNETREGRKRNRRIDLLLKAPGQ